MPRKVYVPRVEPRIPMEVGVELSGRSDTFGTEMTFTENVSSRGARVVTSHRWRADEVLRIASLPGDFRSTARVAYCEAQRGGGFAIGLEFLEPAGSWVVPPPDSGAYLNG